MNVTIPPCPLFLVCGVIMNPRAIAGAYVRDGVVVLIMRGGVELPTTEPDLEVVYDVLLEVMAQVEVDELRKDAARTDSVAAAMRGMLGKLGFEVGPCECPACIAERHAKAN